MFKYNVDEQRIKKILMKLSCLACGILGSGLM
jgi:hypothetical protein